MDENAERISLELIAGDEQAFDTVYKQYYRGLCAFASQYVTVPESEEIVQDVMMWLWENRKSLVADMSLKSLLFTIVRNKCLNTISHIQVKQQVHERLYAKFQEQFENPDFYIGELMALASKAIRELPDDRGVREGSRQQRTGHEPNRDAKHKQELAWARTQHNQAR